MSGIHPQELQEFLVLAKDVLQRWQNTLPPLRSELNWQTTYVAACQKESNGSLYLLPLWQNNPHANEMPFVALDDLLCIDAQKAQLMANTQAFLAGHDANHALLSGSRGCGKSALVKAIVQAFYQQGLRLVEVGQELLSEIPAILQKLRDNPTAKNCCFLLYCDDLSFELQDASYKKLKSILDGSFSTPLSGVRFLFYASSNRRHLLPQFFSDNEGYKHINEGEVHASETVEEKIALSERFGLWLRFYPFNQEDYLKIVSHWLQRAGDIATVNNLPGEIRGAALQYALERASRSGRVAIQFVRQWRQGV